VAAAGVTKDSQWIADLHEKHLLELTDQKPYRSLGVLMDNTKANRAAMRMLKQEYPHLLAIGCQGHGLSLFLKDMAKDSDNIVSKTFSRANTIVNAVNDSEKLRALVQDKQQDIYGKVSVPVHTPTL
jgi:hypothetical protein